METDDTWTLRGKKSWSRVEQGECRGVLTQAASAPVDVDVAMLSLLLTGDVDIFLLFIVFSKHEAVYFALHLSMHPSCSHGGLP